jgi:hypothetical protein
MARVAASHRSPPQSLVATVTLGGDDFPFRLCTRPLALGSGQTIQYFWMDSSAFRISQSRRAADPGNFRNCLGHWWRSLQLQGLAREPLQLRRLLLSTSYALVSASKGLQQVYRDAYIAPRATDPIEASLPEVARDRIQAVVQSQDLEQVRQALNEALGGVDIVAEELTVMRQTCEGILSHGVELVQQRGEDGLEEFLGRFDAWCAKRRRKGGQGWLRRFLNAIAYECKSSFYRCYSEVWIDLIPWLRQHRALDDLSERFLRYWHRQGQSPEQSHNRGIPDVLRGQVLALHPLSGFFMKDPALCAIAGRFFGSKAYERMMVKRRAKSCAEYWDLLGAILTAAYLYRQALDEQEQRRGSHLRSGQDGEWKDPAPRNRSAEGLLEEFAASRDLRCPSCGGSLRVQRYERAADDVEAADVHFSCGTCASQLCHRIGRAELERDLLS